MCGAELLDAVLRCIELSAGCGIGTVAETRTRPLRWAKVAGAIKPLPSRCRHRQPPERAPKGEREEEK